MSDRELRQVLRDVIEDIDTGRVVPWRGGRRLKTMLAGAALAAGLALTGCTDEAVGVAPDAGPDTGATDAYGIPLMDTGATDAYGIPQMDTGVPTDVDVVDAGPTEDYGAPDVDAGPMPDDGGVFLYGVPPLPEDER